MTDVMFPGGSPELVEPIYKNPQLSAPFNEQLAAAIRTFVQHCIQVFRPLLGVLLGADADNAAPLIVGHARNINILLCEGLPGWEEDPHCGGGLRLRGDLCGAHGGAGRSACAH